MEKPEIIINEIRSKLNGEREHDLAILKEYSQKYAQSPPSSHIIQRIGQLAIEHLGDRGFEEFESLSHEGFEKIQDEIEESFQLASEGKLEEAIERFKAIVDSAREVFLKEGGDDYYSFEQGFEEIMFVEFMRPSHGVRRTPILYDKLFYTYGVLLFDAKKYTESAEAFREALRFNPVKVEAFFELGELAKLNDDLEALNELTQNAQQYCFRRAQLARCYRNYGHIALRKQKYKLASAMFHVAESYFSHDVSLQAIQSLKKISPLHARRPKQSVVETLAANEGIPIGPNLNVYSLALRIGQNAKNQAPALARSAFEIAYDITHYKEILKEIESLNFVEK